MRRLLGSTVEVIGQTPLVELGRMVVPIPGAHNVSNALAAVAVALELELQPQVIFAALATFRNAHRRFEVRGERDGVMVVDDYGHHPTEIAATIRAARRNLKKRVIVLFQPHRYTRTQATNRRKQRKPPRKAG